MCVRGVGRLNESDSKFVTRLGDKTRSFGTGTGFGGWCCLAGARSGLIACFRFVISFLCPSVQWIIDTVSSSCIISSSISTPILSSRTIAMFIYTYQRLHRDRRQANQHADGARSEIFAYDMRGAVYTPSISTVPHRPRDPMNHWASYHQLTWSGSSALSAQDVSVDSTVARTMSRIGKQHPAACCMAILHVRSRLLRAS